MEDFLLDILVTIVLLLAINLRYYISIHDNNLISRRTKKVFFILGNVIVIICLFFLFTVE